MLQLPKIHTASLINFIDGQPGNISINTFKHANCHTHLSVYKAMVIKLVLYLQFWHLSAASKPLYDSAHELFSNNTKQHNTTHCTQVPSFSHYTQTQLHRNRAKRLRSLSWLVSVIRLLSFHFVQPETSRVFQTKYFFLALTKYNRFNFIRCLEYYEISLG